MATASQFKAICADRPETKPLALPSPKQEPARLAAELEKLTALRKRTNQRPKEWAYRLQEAERNQQPISVAARHAWRDALRSSSGDGDAVATGSFTPVPTEALPPAMQPDHRGEALP